MMIFKEFVFTCVVHIILSYVPKKCTCSFYHLNQFNKDAVNVILPLTLVSGEVNRAAVGSVGFVR